MIEDFQAEIRRQLQLCDSATTNHHKGKAFDDLICFLFETVPGITTRRNKKNVFETEEVDVFLWNEFFPGGLPSPAFPPWILVECKNWSTKVDSMNINWFVSRPMQLRASRELVSPDKKRPKNTLSETPTSERQL